MPDSRWKLISIRTLCEEGEPRRKSRSNLWSIFLSTPSARRATFYKARIAAASWNDRLGSREGASEVTGIDRTRLANIELGTINPHPEEVLMLSDTYNAPELQNHFCSHLCPLGIGTISPIELEELERVTLQLISAMKSLPEVKDGIIDIAADGVIDAKEKPRMEQYLEILDEITNKAQTLKLIYRKQFGKQEV